jgi:hypothetical protein
VTRRKSAAKPGAPMPQMSERSEAAGPSNQEKVTHHYQALLDAQTRISELFNKLAASLKRFLGSPRESSFWMKLT